MPVLLWSLSVLQKLCRTLSPQQDPTKTLFLNPAATSSPGHEATTSFGPRTQGSFLLQGPSAPRSQSLWAPQALSLIANQQLPYLSNLGLTGFLMWLYLQG